MRTNIPKNKLFLNKKRGWTQQTVQAIAGDDYLWRETKKGFFLYPKNIKEKYWIKVD